MAAFTKPIMGIDWDIFTRDDGYLQVQRVDDLETISDAEAIVDARRLGIACDDDGFILDEHGQRKEAREARKRRAAVLAAAAHPWEHATN